MREMCKYQPESMSNMAANDHEWNVSCVPIMINFQSKSNQFRPSLGSKVG